MQKEIKWRPRDPYYQKLQPTVSEYWTDGDRSLMQWGGHRCSALGVGSSCTSVHGPGIYNDSKGLQGPISGVLLIHNL